LYEERKESEQINIEKVSGNNVNENIANDIELPKMS